MWSAIWAPNALRELERLEPPERERVAKTLLRALEDPPRHFQRLRGTRLHKLRVGDLRVLALVLVRDRTIEVLRVRHRSNVYDR